MKKLDADDDLVDMLNREGIDATEQVKKLQKSGELQDARDAKRDALARKRAGAAEAKQAKVSRQQFQQIEKHNQDRTKQLGNQFMTQAELELAGADPRDRAKVMKNITQAAQQRMMAQGATRGQAQVRTMGLEGQLSDQIRGHLSQSGLQNNRDGMMQLQQLLYQVLQDQAAMNAGSASAMQQLKMIQQSNRASIQRNRSAQNNGTF